MKRAKIQCGVRGLAAVLCGLTAVAVGVVQAGASRPNIVLFLVDDLGWQDTSVAFHVERTPFNEHFRTPHMERLARQGVRFTNAYAAAICSPTRTAIMTGQNPARHRVTNWTLYPDRDQSARRGRVQAPRHWRREGLQPDALTLPKLLQGVGYVTIHCGKAHWGAIGTPGADPRKLGFDFNIAGHAAGGPGSYLGVKNFGNRRGEHTLPWGVPGLQTYHGKDVNLTDVLTMEASRTVTTAVNAGRPFYLYMAHYAVHVPFAPHDPYYRAYRDRGVDRKEAQYASMVQGMDASLGRLLATFEKLGVAEKTIVLFASDNGGLSIHGRGKTPMGTTGDTHNLPLREGKGSAYEGGTRIPMIVSWAKPAREHPLQQQLPIRGNSICAHPVICEDFFPTICHWAGLRTRPKQAEAIDGKDITGYVVGDPAFRRPGPLLFHYPHVWGPGGPGYQPHSAVRVGDWKAIYFYSPRRWELYNLAEDLGEQHNLAAAEPDKLVELASTMRAHFADMQAQYPIDRRTGEPDPPQWPKPE